MKPKFYSSYCSLKLAILLALVVAPQAGLAQEPTVERLDSGAVLITYPNGTMYTNVNHAGDPVGSSVSKGGEWTDCRKNEAKCREELEEAEGGDKPGEGEGEGEGKNGKGKGKKNKKPSTQSGADSQVPTTVRELKQLSVEGLLKLPGNKQVTRMSKKEFMTKYGRSMNKPSRR